LNNYIELIKKLRQEKVNIFLFGGPDEEAENRKIIEEVGEEIILVKTDNIRETAAIIKKCSLFVSVDNVLMHIASAMNVRQVVIAGPSYDKCVEPKSNPVVVASDIECRPCYKYNGKSIRCTREEKMKCLREITPDRVYGIIKNVLK
jgi:ADP-heptose:LPS heptosyltransferase